MKAGMSAWLMATLLLLEVFCHASAQIHTHTHSHGLRDLGLGSDLRGIGSDIGWSQGRGGWGDGGLGVGRGLGIGRGLGLGRGRGRGLGRGTGLGSSRTLDRTLGVALAGLTAAATAGLVTDQLTRGSFRQPFYPEPIVDSFYMGQQAVIPTTRVVRRRVFPSGGIDQYPYWL